MEESSSRLDEWGTHFVSVATCLPGINRYSADVISWMYITEADMRTLVDIPEDELEALTSLSRSRRVSRAELIRQAVAGFLAQNKAGLEDSFGLWKGRGVDGVEYQEKLRREWKR